MTEQEAIEIFKNFPTWNLDDRWLDEADMEKLTETAISALEEVQQYRAWEERLKKVYGDCPGLLELTITHLEHHVGIDIPEPVFKARLLTDGVVDQWEAYKALGTPEELREAREKQQKQKPLYDKRISVLSCPICGGYLQKVIDDNERTTDGAIPHYCGNCGQAILARADWSST